MNIALITGSGGLIGSSCVEYFSSKYDLIIGIDDNHRGIYYGKDGSVKTTIDSLVEKYGNYRHYDVDITDYKSINSIFQSYGNDIKVILHNAAQVSHDYPSVTNNMMLDFNVNATATVNLLNNFKNYSSQAVFIYMSTNKVYGDNPNKLDLIELETRYDYKDERYFNYGIDETMNTDECLHSLFGVSKYSGELATREVGKYFGLKTGTFRGGCLTGWNNLQKGVPLHGYLSYIIKCAKENKKYYINGYKKKAVRDQIASYDVCSAFDEFIKNPKCGEVYNLGGGKENSISITETINLLQEKYNLKLDYEYLETPRRGDHIVYYSDLRKFQSQYPNWNKKYSVIDIFDKIVND